MSSKQPSRRDEPRALPRFEELNFGSRSAEKESRFSPELLRKGFIDHGQVLERIRSREFFFIIGPKGSGKSAIVEKMYLDSRDSGYPYYTTTHVVGDVPHNLLKKIVPGQESAEVSYRRAWKYICYVLLYRSLSEDPYFETDGALKKDDVDFLLARTGLKEAESLSDIVTKSKAKVLKAATKNLGASRETLQEYEGIGQDVLYETVRDHVLMGRSSRHHYIFIDGLDRVFSASPGFRQSVSALLGSVFDVNMELVDNSVPATVVALARRDMLDYLDTPDLAKFTGDHGASLDWFDARIEPTETGLWKLINRRASISAKTTVDVYRDYLPAKMKNGDNPVKFLLDRTRHRPRDLIELMNNVAQATKRQKPLSQDIDAGYTRYSEKYLLPEVQDELKGFLNAEEIRAAFDLLRAIRKIRFSNLDARNAMKDERFQGFDLRQLLSALFDCGAIGHIAEGPGYESFIRFKFRNENDTFNPNLDCFVQTGLWRALNI